MNQSTESTAPELRKQAEQNFKTLESRLEAVERRHAELSPMQVMKLAAAQRSLAEMWEHSRITFNALAELERRS